MRARAQQESRIRDEEAARTVQQLKEQERVAAEEASRWVQQRQQLEEQARREEVAASTTLKPSNPPKVLPQTPDLTFSRPNVQMTAQLKEQERMAAEEASRWVQQRQQLEERARREEMSASTTLKSPNPPKVLPQTPDLTFSRPNVHAHGSQSTVILLDDQGQGRGHVDVSRNNQQEQMRPREDEITRKRREEQEGIARRQYESEEAARAARQNLATQNLPYPPNSTSTANAPPTLPLFPTHLGASSSTVPKSAFYPTAVQYPKLGPTAMPLESPHYEGNSTDSESLHHDFRRLGMNSDNQRFPMKPVRR